MICFFNPWYGNKQLSRRRQFCLVNVKTFFVHKTYQNQHAIHWFKTFKIFHKCSLRNDGQYEIFNNANRQGAGCGIFYVGMKTLATMALDEKTRFTIASYIWDIFIYLGPLQHIYWPLQNKYCIFHYILESYGQYSDHFGMMFAVVHFDSQTDIQKEVKCSQTLRFAWPINFN